jgi:hypothetical protein
MSNRRDTETGGPGALSQMNVFGLLPVVAQVVDRLVVTCVESWGETEREERERC